jgi:large conductance mechanosensitive channel
MMSQRAKVLAARLRMASFHFAAAFLYTRGLFMGLLKEFKEFALRGNVVDMAVGVIIGTAFGKIVTSLVSDVIMPPIGKMMSLGGKATNFKDLHVKMFTEADVQEAVTAKALPANVPLPDLALSDIQKANLPVLTYGSFLSTVLDFVILAFCVFLMVKVMNILFRKKAEAPAPPEPTATEKLLTEIRDTLKANA